MIEQLISLEKKVLGVRKQYHINSTELVNLKAKNTATTNQMTEDLSELLSKTKEQRNSLQERLIQLEKKHREVTADYESSNKDAVLFKQQLVEKTGLYESITSTYDSYKQETKAFRKEYNELKVEKETLVSELDKIKNDKKQLHKDVEYLKADKIALAVEIERFKKEKIQLVDKSRVAAEYAQIALDELIKIK